MQSLLTTARGRSEGFYRIETAQNWTVNDPALYDYHGISEFSSVINTRLTDLARSLGVNAQKGANSMVYNHGTPVINALFNVKYIIGNNKRVAQDSHLDFVAESNGSTLYENKYPLSLGFMVKDSVYDYDVNGSSQRAVAQENLINLATGLDITLFKEIDSPEVSASNMTATYYGNGKITCSAPTNSKQPSTVSLEYVSDKDQDIYFGVTATGLSSIVISIGDGDEVKYTSQGRAAILAGGRAKAGDTIYIDINISAGKSGDIKSRVYGFDDDAWNKAYAALSKNMMTVTEYTDRTVSGTVTADEDGVLLTSIPYDKGWSVKVDGQKVDIKPFANALCAIPLTAGEHTIEFSFFTYGLTLGIIASIFCAGLLALIFFMSRKKTEEKEDGAKYGGTEISDCSTTEEQPVSLSETETAEEKLIEEDGQTEDLQPDESEQDEAIQQEEEPSDEKE